MAGSRRFNGSERRRDPAPAPPPRSVRSAALALLGRRDYTAAELHQKLHDKGYDADAIDRALEDVRARGVIDDRRVAAAHVRTAANVKRRGRVRIARELTARGLDRDAVHEAMQELDPADEAAAIRKILLVKRWPSKPSLKERQKMFRHLMSRGFTSDAISRALGRSSDDD